ncbi:TetR/AcrR family transcriptional regulator [Variovorax sp. LjRoot178]
MQVIASQGPHAVSVATVMGDAGLTHGGFYAHFNSKDALIEASVAKMFEDSYALWGRATRERSPAKGLARYIDLYLCARHLGERERGCPIAALSSDVPRLSPAARVAFDQGVRTLTALISEPLAALGRPALGKLASSVLAELVGCICLARLQRSRRAALELLEASRSSLRDRLSLPSTPNAVVSR